MTKTHPTLKNGLFSFIIPDEACKSSQLGTLAQPITLPISQKTAPNRFLKAAMTERLCTYDLSDEFSRGEPTKELEKVYEVWGKTGGLGLLHTGNIMVHRTHLEAEGNAILDRENPKSFVSAFARLQRAACSHSLTPPLLIGQLAHVGGQMSRVDKRLTLEGISDAPVHWTYEGIQDIVERFAFAADALKQANFDGVQIHGAYGCFITQFLSSTINKRTDRYGGSLENRSRILLEIIAASKQRVADPSFSFSVKINATDFIKGDMSHNDIKTLASRLETAGIDYIELSGGTYEGVTDGSELDHDARQAHFLAFSGQIRAGLSKTLFIPTGGFTTAHSMEQAVDLRNADVVGLARSLAHEPTLAAAILSGKVQAAKPNKLPKSTIINLEAGIEQIQRMGHSLPLLDFSNDEVVKEWLEKRGYSEQG